MKQLESQEQQALVQWWHIAHKNLGAPERLLFAIPNGGQRNIATAARLKREGVKAGIPDMMLAVPRGGYHGLFVELKIKGGRLSEYQKAALEELEAQGYATAVAYGFQEARKAIEEYLQ